MEFFFTLTQHSAKNELTAQTIAGLLHPVLIKLDPKMQAQVLSFGNQTNVLCKNVFDHDCINNWQMSEEEQGKNKEHAKSIIADFIQEHEYYFVVSNFRC